MEFNFANIAIGPLKRRYLADSAIVADLPMTKANPAWIVVIYFKQLKLLI
jgi:hypothetical protein